MEGFQVEQGSLETNRLPSLPCCPPPPKKGPLGNALGFLAFLLLFSQPPLAAEDVYHENEHWGASIPATWELLEIQPQLTSFSDQEGRAIFQIFSFPAGQFPDLASLAQPVIQNLNAKAETVDFVYQLPAYLAALYRGDSTQEVIEQEIPGSLPRPELLQAEAMFADLSWSSSRINVRGYAVFLHGGQKGSSYALLAYVVEDWYEAYHDFLLSTLDSFQPWMMSWDEYLRAPGPVSQFLVSPGELARSAGTLALNQNPPASFRGSYPALLAQRAEATQVLIEREARILAQYQEAPKDYQLEAWRRFYQLIYRDSFADLAAEAISSMAELSSPSHDPREWAAPLLTMLQSYEYRRNPSISDLEAPQTAVLDLAGDCDTLVLLYLALLDHFGIDGIVMVSSVHQHSLAGVGSGILSPNPNANARFTFDAQDWLVAELTVEVDLGLVASTMADPKDWIGFDLRFQPIQ